MGVEVVEEFEDAIWLYGDVGDVFLAVFIDRWYRGVCVLSKN